MFRVWGFPLKALDFKFRWVVLYIGNPFRGLFIRVPYCIGDLKRDLDLDNYP